MSQVSTEALRASAAGSRPPVKKSTFRPEVQGLRALAVLMVVTYHIWFGRVSGGVDIFLLISAFLLSLSFLRKVEAGRPLDLIGYWLHMFKRLLPAVVVVLIGVLTATALFVPKSRWTEILAQAWSSLLYFQNWVLAANSVDYYAADHSIASPLQHFWSLSVQGQVFILWPVIFALAALLAKLTRLRYRTVVLVLFGSVFIASLAFSIAETYGNQAHAYFDTRTRLWEFAFGTLLALAIPYLNFPKAVRVVAGWAGLATMLSVGFVLDVQGQFPGYVALVPLLAAALVIVAGQTESRLGADRFLSWKPLARLGDMSYALYLWHWPVLVIYLIWRDRQEVGIVGGTAIIVLSLVLAYLTTRFVERPLRSASWIGSRRSRSLLVIATCLALVAVPVFSWQAGLQLQADRQEAAAELNNPGARALLNQELVNGGDGSAIPGPTRINEDWGELDGPCVGPDEPGTAALDGRCSMTVPEAPEKTLLVVGDSHAQQWLGAIEPMARKSNYKVVAMLMGGCSFGAESPGRSEECNEFNAAAADYAVKRGVDAVITVASAASPDSPEDRIVSGLPEAAADLTRNGISVVGIRDNPRYSFNMFNCSQSAGPEDCAVDQSLKLAPEAPFGWPGGVPAGVGFVDMTDLICPDGTCSPVIGNVNVYIDNNHLTATYTGTMSDEFDARFHAALGWR